jgi:sporulation protein YlmC with PRC-barrel domain
MRANRWLALFVAGACAATVNIARSDETAPPVRSSDLVGLRVDGQNNRRLGKIEDLVIDPDSGKIRYAVLSFGGFLGMGDKLFAVPWGALTQVSTGRTSANTVKEDHYFLNVTVEALKQAPGFDKNHWPDFANATWAETVEKFYKDNVNQGTQRR